MGMNKKSKIACFALLLFTLLFTLLITLPFVGCEKKNTPATEQGNLAAKGSLANSLPDSQPVPGELVIVAEVAEIPGTFPANELYNYAYVMKYTVQKVIKGAYADADILIAHYNPRIARAEIKDDQDSQVGGNIKSFQVGDVHYLVLGPMEGTWNGASEDDFFKDKRARYWALWADKVK